MARQDLRSIVQYIGKDNPTRAESFGQELREKTKPLAQHPELGRPSRVPGIRELVAHQNYILIYRIVGKVVEVLRVKHAAQQWP